MVYPDDVPFIRGLDLCEQFFTGLVKPLLDEYFPYLNYAACRLGPGSDILGFDTVQSRDHDWGPKLDILVEDIKYIDELDRFFTENLRHKSICGYSTQFKSYSDDGKQTVFINVPNESSSKNTCHGIHFMTMRQFFIEYLNWDIEQNQLTCKEWLTFPSQRLSTIIRGRIYYNSDNVNIKHIQNRLNYYPNDVWLYLIACCWNRIGQEEHLMGRAGQVSDELGSAIIANRLIRDIMRLVFLLERQYYPYPKWFGTAFRNSTKNGSDFEPILRQIQLAATWQEREQKFNTVYEKLAKLTQTTLNISINIQVSQFHNRPFQIINGGVIADIIFTQIQDEQIRNLPKVGSTDLFTDTENAMVPEFRMKFEKIYE